MDRDNNKRSEFQARSQEVEQLVKKLEKAGDPETHAIALELVQSVIDLHAAALERMMEVIARTPEGESVLMEATDDELVSGMMLLHGLHPEALEIRVLRALDKVRPYLHSHGGDVEMVSITDGILRLRLQGTCGNCSSSALTMKNAVEEAVYDAAPDILEIVDERANDNETVHSSKLVVLK